MVEGLDAGADDFLSKPFRQPELLARIRSALRLRQALARMDAAHTAVAALANAVEAKDPSTERHCQRLANLAARLGCPGRAQRVELEAVAYGALLHDVGKIGVPESILTKPAPLDAAEWDADAPPSRDRRADLRAARRRRHVHARSSATTTSAGTDAATRTACAARRSRSGRGSSALVDAFDAMTHDRPYRRAMPVPVAINELWREAGGQFDRALVPLFVLELERGGETISAELPPSALLATG